MERPQDVKGRLSVKCSKPFQIGVHPHGCGQCLACRINRRRIWTNRIMLEAGSVRHKSFVTLTYKDEEMPENGSLDRSDLKGFIKNLRYSIRPRKVRYYAVGEYGDKSWRPHYHIVLFGYPNCRFGNTSICIKKIEGGCPECRYIANVWRKGHVFLGDINTHSVQYVAGYVTKFSGKKKCTELGHRLPEFATMSLKPGIGANALFPIADVVKEAISKGWLENYEVPSQIKVDGKDWPLGRYLTRRLRKIVGIEEETPKEVLENVGWKMRFMLEENIKRKGWPKSAGLDKVVIRMNLQQSRSLKKREEIYKSRRSI